MNKNILIYILLEILLEATRCGQFLDQKSQGCIVGVRYIYYILSILSSVLIFVIIIFTVNLNYDSFSYNVTTVR